MKITLVIIALAVLVACERKGPAEKAGESIDNAGRAASRSIEKAGENIRDAAKGKN